MMIYLTHVNIIRLILTLIAEMLIQKDTLTMKPLFKLLAIKVCVLLVALRQLLVLLKTLVVMNTVVMENSL